MLMKTAVVPIVHYSFETTGLLKDEQARWQSMRRLRESCSFVAKKDAAVAAARRTPTR
jgi:NTE family protein